MKFLEFFSEDNGRLSNMRLNSTLAIWTALFMVFSNIRWGTAIDQQVFLMLLGAGFGFKLVQKFAETKGNGETAESPKQ